MSAALPLEARLGGTRGGAVREFAPKGKSAPLRALVLGSP